MRLTDLEPQFLVCEGNGWREVDTLAEAQGIMFLCPKCQSHSVVCWSRSRGTPDKAQPGPGRWAMKGTGYADLTLDADPPSSARSVLLNGGCGWHGFVSNGEAA